MPTPRPEITQKYLHECFDYDPEMGTLIWRVRPSHHFSKSHGMKVFNSRFSGEEARSKHSTGGRVNCLVVRIMRKHFRVHRVIWFYMFGDWPKNEIDHIDGDPLNNRLDNLRDVTHQENTKNRKVYATNTSGNIGVTYHPTRKHWQARIYTNNKSNYLGCFPTFSEACQARAIAEKKYGFHVNHGKR